MQHTKNKVLSIIIIINKDIYASGSPLIAFWRRWNSFLTHLSSFVCGSWVSWKRWWIILNWV